MHAGGQGATHAAAMRAHKRQDRCSKDSSASSLIAAVHVYGACEEEPGCEQPSSSRQALARHWKQHHHQPWPSVEHSLMPSRACLHARCAELHRALYQNMHVPLQLSPIVHCITFSVPLTPQGEALCRACAWWEKPGSPGRWCEWCGAYQRLRAHHCSLCARCIDTFDHHCVWLGTCVGARNQAMCAPALLCCLKSSSDPPCYSVVYVLHLSMRPGTLR